MGKDFSMSESKAPRCNCIDKSLGGGERTTMGIHGKIVSKDTIAPGNDPNPPRDREH